MPSTENSTSGDWKRPFFHFAWTGGMATLVNMALVGLLTDLIGIPGVLSVAVGGLIVFGLRFNILRRARVL